MWYFTLQILSLVRIGLGSSQEQWRSQWLFLHVWHFWQI